ncbi:hypothetical protein [Chromobacterium phragmitis]|uniref:Uncharacterized protein n=1 Tax=Chromobacterium phragmitis TaxID=2202141 RepID=A0ABV0IVK3_9NEIS
MTYVTTSENGDELMNEPSTSLRGKCGCGTWIEHWKKYAEKTTVPTCIVAGCNEQATDGAHVEFTQQTKFKGLTYIAPMCGDHNKDHDLVFTSKPGYRLARGSQAETCAKKAK